MADDRKREPLTYRPAKRPVVRELVSLACLACVLATASIYWHYRLPTPLAPTTPLAPRRRDADRSEGLNPEDRSLVE